MQPVMVMFAYKGFGLRNLMHSKIDFIEYFGRRQEKKKKFFLKWTNLHQI